MDKWLVVLLKQIMTQLSPQIRGSLEAFVNQMDTEAKETVNPWDDVLVGVLKLVLAIK